VGGCAKLGRRWPCRRAPTLRALPPHARTQAIKEGAKRFIFLGQDIRLIPSCGIFVTMNPGYAGRSELPDNLKVCGVQRGRRCGASYTLPS